MTIILSGRRYLAAGDLSVNDLVVFKCSSICIRSESASLVESDDRVRELSKENVTLKEQVFLVQEKVRELQVEIAAKNSEISAAKRGIEELNRNA
ncbi:hypothetical protein ANCDUO_19287, partial [Ancylostoma duodenale]